MQQARDLPRGVIRKLCRFDLFNYIVAMRRRAQHRNRTTFRLSNQKFGWSSLSERTNNLAMRLNLMRDK